MPFVDDHSLTFCNSCAWKRTRARRRAQREKYARLSPEEQKNISGQLAPLTEEEEKALREELDKTYPPPEAFDGWRAWYKYTDIEVTAALFRGFSIGFNPGELLDFLAGFICLDLYGDDISLCSKRGRSMPDAGLPPEKESTEKTEISR